MDKILKTGRRGVHLYILQLIQLISNNPVLPAHATTAPPQTVAEKALAVGMKSALRKLPAMRGRGKARGGRAGRGGGRGGKRMYTCSVCGKPGTRKGHAPPCDPNMKEKWERQMDADVGEEEDDVSADSSDGESQEDD